MTLQTYKAIVWIFEKYKNKNILWLQLTTSNLVDGFAEQFRLLIIRAAINPVLVVDNDT